MRLIARRALAVSLALLLAGCAPDSRPERWTTLPPEQTGGIFGAITADISGQQFTRYQLRYRNLDTGETAFLSLSPPLVSPPMFGTPDAATDNNEPILYERGRMVGVLFDVRLPPGRYAFYNMRLVQSGPGVTREFSAATSFALPFTVEQGVTHYLGDIRGYPTLGRNIFGMPLASGGYFVIRDRFDRDLRLLERRRASTAVGRVVNSVPDVDAAGTPLLRRAPLPPYDGRTDS
jgi:hypothetical protein